MSKCSMVLGLTHHQNYLTRQLMQEALEDDGMSPSVTGQSVAKPMSRRALMAAGRRLATASVTEVTEDLISVTRHSGSIDIETYLRQRHRQRLRLPLNPAYVLGCFTITACAAMYNYIILGPSGLTDQMPAVIDLDVAFRVEDHKIPS